MGLTKLINQLKSKIDSQGVLDMEEVDKLTKQAINLPQNIEQYNPVEFQNFNYGGNKHPTPLYHLTISSDNKMTLDEVEPILNELFTQAKELTFEKGTTELEYKVIWTEEGFQKEKSLGSADSDKLSIYLTAKTVDAEMIRLIPSTKDEEINVNVEGNFVSIKATDGYRTGLKNLIDLIHPQYAILQVSKEDAEKLMANPKALSHYGPKLKARLETAFKPAEGPPESASFEEWTNIFLSGDTREKGEVAKATHISMPTKELSKFYQLIGKPLFNGATNDLTKVIELKKKYGPIDKLRKTKLSDLQSITESFSNMNLGIRHDYPVISTGEAKALLEQEIKLIDEGYKEIGIFDYIAQAHQVNIVSSINTGPKGHQVRKGAVINLAKEHFGEEITTPIDEMNSNDYITFLTSKGYKPTQTFEVEEEIKERHLFEFFKASFAENPDESIETYRESYINPAQKLEIDARAYHRDATELKKLKLPSNSKLIKFSLDEHMQEQTPYSNGVGVNMLIPEHEKVSLFSRTNLENPTMLGLQEYACKELGVTFK
ncbi:hypothetical protein ACFLTH_09555 [Bacteroidota bacterium]